MYGSDDTAALIKSLFERNGSSLYGGESVTQLEHALQAALLAEIEGADPALIVAALLHDVGHLLHDLSADAPDVGVDDVHEQLAYDWLRDYFGPEVTEPVRMHVDAKRYLCAVDPQYEVSLSPPSQQSLLLQGGRYSEKFRRWKLRHWTIFCRTWKKCNFPARVSKQRHERIASRTRQNRVAPAGKGTRCRHRRWDRRSVHAWAAARRGHQVLLFERHPRACGASIRNFGMVWPIGQPNGRLHRAAMLSHSLWMEILPTANLWHDACGSLHLAYRPDELDVLSEFAQIARALDYECRLVDRREVCELSSAVQREGLLGGLWSPTELCVDPREVIARLPLWLHEQYGVELLFDTPVENVSHPWVVAADRRRWQVDRAIIAAGADFRTLYPDLFKRAGFRVCKLQMLRTLPQPNGWRLGPMLAGGLTLRHYAAFSVCETLRPLKERIACFTPELDRFGIHVLVSQNGLGEVILGDSHEYGDDISPFDKMEIENLILRELRRIVDLPDWTIQERWHGVYAQIPGEVQFVHEVEPNVTVAIASGGCGMTMSFGLAEEYWSAADRSPADGMQPAARGTLA